MFVNFDNVFNPSREFQKKFSTQFEEMQSKAIEEKRCFMCENTYHEPWNNHGHPDFTTMCKFTDKCVDFCYADDCENWDPKTIRRFE